MPERSCGGDFPGGPVVKTSPSNAGGAGSIPGQGAKIPHASQPKKKKKKNPKERGLVYTAKAVTTVESL